MEACKTSNHIMRRTPIHMMKTTRKQDSIKILMLEDVETDADLIQRQLTRDNVKFTAERVDEEQEFIDALDAFKPDVILSDHAMPQFNSMAALEIAQRLAPKVPFILVTGSVSEEFAVTCIKSGADDYILKSNLVRLPNAIRASLEKRHLETENTIIRNLNKEIEKKNDELHYMNQEKDRFVGIVSHDLQNGISAMMLTLSMLEKDTTSINEKQWNYIKRLHRSTANMYKLLSDFLTVNRIQRGVIEPLYSLVNLGNMVQDLVDGYEDVATRKNIKLNYTNNCEDAFFRTDMSYAGIIADNLISNAIKYSPRGKEIDIKVSKKGTWYMLEVKDYGPGIPESDMAKLYGRFQKLSTKPTGGEPSNGLGLSIVKDLVDSLKAGIQCKSKVGQGTTFTVTF
jgi:signal transduction histidine kinase